MKTELTNWEFEFIQASIEREFEIHDIDNWQTKEDADNFLLKLQSMAHKFKIDYLEEQ